MKAKDVTPPTTSPVLVTDLDDGLTPTVQALLEQAASAVQAAIAAAERALDAAEEDSDACCRCDETLRHLEEALVLLRWAPPAQH